MDSTMISAYRALNEAQAAISRANTLDEALQDGLRIILANCDAEFGVIWYADPKGDDALHPFFWVGKYDLTSRYHRKGQGVVGRVFESQEAERYLDFKPEDDPATVEDFQGVNVTSMICVPLAFPSSTVTRRSVTSWAGLPI